MNSVAIAAKRFEEGFNCAQAVLCACCEAHHLAPPETALKTAAAFGSGMARRAGTCGAVTGALMAIGLRHGAQEARDTAAKERTYAEAQAFIDRFQELHGSIECRTLLGVDVSTPEGLAQAKHQRLHQTVCPHFVRDAARLADEYL